MFFFRFVLFLSFCYSSSPLLGTSGNQNIYIFAIFIMFYCIAVRFCALFSVHIFFFFLARWVVIRFSFSVLCLCLSEWVWLLYLLIVYYVHVGIVFESSLWIFIYFFVSSSVGCHFCFQSFFFFLLVLFALRCRCCRSLFLFKLNLQSCENISLNGGLCSPVTLNSLLVL